MRFRTKTIWLTLAVAALAVLAVMLIWNAVMTSIFGLPALNYGQALLLLLMSRLLFGGLGHHGLGALGLKSRWRGLSPEDRAKILESHGLGRHGGGRFHHHEHDRERDCRDRHERGGHGHDRADHDRPNSDRHSRHDRRDHYDHESRPSRGKGQETGLDQPAETADGKPQATDDDPQGRDG
jgi:hypothetical protein